MSLVVTATDTEVGKTIISALILERFGGNHHLAYWKPVASGARDDRDTHTVRQLVGKEIGKKIEILAETYLFQEPLSPHLAARLEGKNIDRSKILGTHQHLVAEVPHRQLVIEGVGGLLVPLNEEGYLLADLFVDLDLPLLVVARSTLGTLNHTLLTLEAIRRRGLKVAGVVLNGPRNEENRHAIEKFGEVEVLFEVEPLDTLDRPSITKAARGFDIEGRLEIFLQ
jgi:dethiobiotin synthase